jgi:integrase
MAPRLKRAGIGAVKFHLLRHTANSLMIAMDVRRASEQRSSAIRSRSTGDVLALDADETVR